MNNLLLIGNGKFGKNYVNTLDNFSNVKLTIATKENWKNLIDNKPDGVLVCTQPDSHIEIASYALEKDIPTMIEKPLALSLKECDVLQKYKAPILVNHIHLFANGYQTIKKEVTSFTYIESVGTGNNQNRTYSRLWDYGPHDVAMILDLAQEYPSDIQCSELNDKFTIKMKFNDFETVTNIGFSKIRQRYLNVNDTHMYNGENETPLTTALNVFIDAINGKSDYRLGTNLSFNIMRVLDKCQEILDNSEKPQ
jgi:hypothetical protein